LTVNITHLPPPTQSTTVPWIYHYSSDSGLVAAVSLTVGQTVYTPDPKSVAPLIDVSVGDDLSSNFSSMDFNVAFSSPNYIIAGGLASAYWNGNYFPNGSLPATLPSLSGAHSPILIVNVIGPSGTLVDQTYTLTSASTCTTTTTPPVVVSGPTISSISPATPTASPGNQTVTVFGSQFQSGLTATLFNSSGSTTTLSGGQIQGVSATAFQMTVNLSAPGTFGLRVNNPDGRQTGTFTFAVIHATPPMPTINPGGNILNSASFSQGAIAPGSLASIFGTNFAIANTLADSIPLPISLAGISVTFNGIAAPISGVFHDSLNGDQINVQVPWAISSPGTAQVVVTRDGVSSPSQPVAIAAAVPGIFAIQLNGSRVVGSGLGQAIAYGNNDGIIAAPAGAITGLATHPAKINDPSTLVILATGLGAVDTTVKNGDVPSVVASNTLTKPTVTIGDVPAQVVFSGLVGRDASGKALGFVGVYQINVIVAPGTPTGSAVKLQVSMNRATSRSDVTIAVSQ
jgi:uncharacterized protein (TIGR03437 family)